MNLIKLAIERPVSVVAAMLMTVLFGLVALQTIPIQLTPDVNRPVITVTTAWPGAAPAEVEREIINPQEKELSGLSALQNVTSTAEQGRGRITLEFSIGTDMSHSLLLVSNRLDRVSSYPAEASAPTFEIAGSEESPIAWFIVRRAAGNARPIHEFGDFLEDIVRDRMERVDGVARLNIYGISNREIQVVVKPGQLAAYRLTVSDVLRALRAANISVSAGDVTEGKRRYVVRAQGELNDLAPIRNVVLRALHADGDGGGRLARITVADVAEVRYGYPDPTASIRMLGTSSLAMSAERQHGANVIETMRGLRAAVDELNQYAMPAAGLTLVQAYDETVYIDSAIDLVQQNIWVGGTLAALVLLLFLRSVRATLVVSIAIPVSVVGAFVAMAFMGRSINVVSLAGLAFAVGMVVDAAIVVMENIYRLRERGIGAVQAALDGARQVWGAVLVSALTTVLVFVPVLVMQLEAGQLFRDIAVAISVAVLLSLVVSITVIPSLSRKFFGGGSRTVDAAPSTVGAASATVVSDPAPPRLRLPMVDRPAALVAALVNKYTEILSARRLAALLVVAAITAGALAFTITFLPKLDYLPEGNRNLVFGVIIPPPGYNLETMAGIAEGVESATRPLWVRGGDGGAIARETGPGAPPGIERFFFVVTRGLTFLGAISDDPQRAGELIPPLQRAVFREPGTFGFINQPSIFGRGIGGGKKIDLDISGGELEPLLEVAVRAVGKIAQILPRAEGTQFRPNPGLELGAPEVRLVPNRVALADNRLDAVDLANTVDTFNDGLRVDEVTLDGKLTDLVLKGPDGLVARTQGIDNLPVVTPDGSIVPVNSLADIMLTAGPVVIRHRERFRAITLEVRPSPAIPLESAVELIRSEVIGALQEEGVPSNIKFSISGTADKLSQTWNAILINLLLALVIVYLVMAVLFESFVYPVVIMLSVPVAAAGGIGGLAVQNALTGQTLDMLSMLGSIILVGIVVNNAILLVHQTLFHTRRENMSPRQAILTATNNRIRPIFMSTLTSVFGMLPLVLFPGSGSELYRGLGSVVVGGLSLSAILTLLIVPPFLAVLAPWLEGRRARAQARA